MTGHPCSECGATMQRCDEHIREHGSGCCQACFVRDTHGLTDDTTIHGQQIANLTRLIAQMVIARSEHAKAIRQLRAQFGTREEQVARMHAAIDDFERRLRLLEIAVTKDPTVTLLNEVKTALADIDDVDDDVEDLQDRVSVLERCLVEIETLLKIKRKAQPKALMPGPPA